MAQPQTKPTALQQKITQPSPTILTRTVKRHIAVCPQVAEQCDFANRAKPELHSSAASAEVESVRHLRAAHKGVLSFEVSAVRKRQITNETLAIVEE